MDISLESRFFFKEDSTKCTLEWSFVDRNLKDILTFHDRINRHLKSDELKFNKIVLAGIPHRMRIFICKNDTIVIHMCTIEGKRSEDKKKNDGFSDYKILDIKMTCSFSNSPEKVFSFEHLRNEAARKKIDKEANAGFHGHQDFLKATCETDEYYFYNAIEIDSNGKPAKSLANAKHHVRQHKMDIYKLSLGMEVTSMLWNENRSVQPADAVSNAVLMDKMCKQTATSKTTLLSTEPYYLSTKFSDFIILSGDKEYPVHKIILEKKSSVFAKLFEDTHYGSHGRHEIKAEPRVVEEFLRFVYTGEVPRMGECAYGLFLIAHQYNVEDLKVLSEKAMEIKGSGKNFGRHALKK